MLYSLASFAPDRETLLFARISQVVRSRPEELGQLLRNWDSLSTPPDVLSVLADEDPDRAWLAAVAAIAAELQAEGRALQLVRCDHTPGELGEAAAVFQDPTLCASVREDDRVLAGFVALRTPATGLAVVPRYVRKVCSNGTVAATGGGVGRSVEPHELGAAIRACLDPGGFEAAIERFRGAAEIRVDDVADLVLAAGTRVTASELRAAAVRDGDRSLWGAINAATALAHDEERWSRRLDREADAARLLEGALRLRRPRTLTLV